MNIKVIASGSKGNVSYISDGDTSLLLDAGIGIKHIREGTNFRISKISGCLVTHEHNDHSKYCCDLARMGVNVYSGGGTLDALGLRDQHRFNTVKAMTTFTVGSFEIMPFDVIHDAAEPLGFLILSNATKDKLLYFVDTAYIRYKFTGITHIIAECNHGNAELTDSVRSGIIDSELAVRIAKNHISVERLIEFLDTNDLSKLREIHLVHLSDNNSNEKKFKQLVQRATGVPVFVH